MRCTVATVLAAALLMLSTGQALGTEITATVFDANETWDAAGSPYVLGADLTVSTAATLTILPGVEVQLAPDVMLYVEGELIARGESASPIVFTARDADTLWGAIVFGPGAASAVFENLHDYVSGSILEYVTIEHGQRALRMEGVSPLVRACTFQHNRYGSNDQTELSGGAALWIGADSAPLIDACTFEDNYIQGFPQGGAVCVEYGEPIIKDNIFRGNESNYGGALVTSWVYSPVVGNTFEDNKGRFEGGGAAFYSSSPTFLNNYVSGNYSLFDGGGVHICVTCFPHANPIVMDNTIINNTNDGHGSAGFGAAYLRHFTANNVYGNMRKGAPLDFGWYNEHPDEYPSWVSQPIIAGNWWGTTDEDEIAAAIEDGDDEEELGHVTWRPALDAPVEAPLPRASITTKKIRYDTDGEPMPVYLTVYNPGPKKRFRLLVLAEIDGRAPVAVPGPFGLPGEEPGADAVRFEMPENGVTFRRILEPDYDATRLEGEALLRVVLFDDASGERIGEAGEARVVLGAGMGGVQ